MLINKNVQHAAFSTIERDDQLSGLNYKEYVHQSGLKLLWIPKPGFNRKFAAFGIPFGSIHQEVLDEFGKTQEIDAGTAHYLEHCIFSRDDEGGLLGKLSSLGCQANAYTSYTQTVYFFTGTERFTSAFNVYLDALLHPYLEEDRVDAERTIIGAELDMYSDDPDSFAFKTMMRNLYIKHGAKEDIGGTKTSIANISSEKLKRIWSRFYTPSSMQIVIVGDFTPDEQAFLLNTLDSALKLQTWPEAFKHALQAEPEKLVQNELELKLAVENPSFLLAVKDPFPFDEKPLTPIALAKRNFASALYLDSIIGEGSELYSQLYEEGLINDSFTAQYVCEEDFAFLFLSCESKDPEHSAKEIFGRLKAAIQSELEPEEIFTVQKRASVGHFLRAVDGVESLGMTVVQASMSGLEISEYAKIIDQVSIAEAKEYLSFIDRDELRIQIYVAEKGE